MQRTEIYDRVYGGWFGKCLGGAAGATVEGVKNIETYTDYKDIYDKDLPNDDLDIQLLWLEALEESGKSLTMSRMAEKWEKQCWYPFSEYGQFLYNYERGIMPPVSGTYNNEFFQNGMGCPIRAEIFGFAFMGDPDTAVKFAEMDGRLDHGDESVFAEMYMAAVEALCMENYTLYELLNVGLKYVSDKSRFYAMCKMIFDGYNKGKSIEDLRNETLRKFGHLDFTNSIQNMAFVLISLLFGEQDMDKTINIALNLGYDTDCTCGNAAAILGAYIGYNKIPDELKALLTDQFVCGIDVKRADDTISGLANDTVNLYEKLLEDKREPFELSYTYLTGTPSINLGGECVVQINNYETIKEFDLTLIDSSLDYVIDKNKGQITFTANKDYVSDKNIYKVTATHNDGRTFEGICGVCGVPTYQAKGIYLEQADNKYNENHPYCHGEGCVLPSVENMVNNKVELHKEYIDESSFAKEFDETDFEIKCKDALIPVENEVAYQGQMCVYVQTKIVSPIKQTVWMCPQNTDGFAMWINGVKVIEKDEMRCFTPYNNAEIVNLEQGENLLTIKLLRRTDSMKFALCFNNYGEGVHYHKTKLLTNLSFK